MVELDYIAKRIKLGRLLESLRDQGIDYELPVPYFSLTYEQIENMLKTLKR